MAGIVPDGSHAVIITAISGRSEGSRNRDYKLDPDTGRVYTAVADPTKQVGDPELTLYDTQLENPKSGLFVASNGRQTNDCVNSDNSLRNLLGNWSFEPDKPNFTPRITCRVNTSKTWSMCEFAIHRKGLDEKCELDCWNLEVFDPGLGCYVCTYESNGDPLPSFVGGPRLITIGSDPLNDLLNGLSSKALVAAISVKWIPLPFTTNSKSNVQIWCRSHAH